MLTDDLSLRWRVRDLAKYFTHYRFAASKRAEALVVEVSFSRTRCYSNCYRESVVEIFALISQRLQRLGQRCRFEAKSRGID